MEENVRGRIVVVDDDSDLLRLMLFLLRSKGFEVLGFSTGQEAKAYLEKEENLQNCSLLILDRLLPDMDGLDILKEMKKTFSKLCPVIILSVLSSDQDILSGLTGGAVDYISKPFNLEIFSEKVKKLLLTQ
jgi:DNA-binding response OmpR family regulator